jgi:hypothetical protein
VALRTPEVRFTGTKHSRTDHFRVRFQPGLIASGLAKHEVPIGAPPAKAKGVPLCVVWPKDLPGTAAIFLREEAAVLEYESARGTQGGEWKPTIEEGMDVSEKLVRIDLAREPGSPATVVHRKTAEPLFRSKEHEGTRFEGVVFDLELLIFDSTDTSKEPAQRLWVEGIPIIESFGVEYDDASDQMEGWHWEVLAILEFRPEAVKTTPLLEKSYDWGGDIDSFSFCTLPRAIALDFKVKQGRDANPQDLAGRYVFGLHVVQSVEGSKHETPMPLVEVVFDEVGVAPRYVPARVDLEFTTKEKEALAGLDDLPLWEQGGKTRRWIKDISIVANPDKLLRRELDTKKNVVMRHLHKVSHYWLMPTDFYSRKEAVSLRKEAELSTARPKREETSIGETQHQVVFTLLSEWDRYAEELGRLERHLNLMKEWQELYAATYAKHKDELEAYTRIVMPICGDKAFGPVEFPTKGSTVGGMHNVKLSSLRHESNSGSTESKLRTLRDMTDRVAWHARKAIAAFESPDISRHWKPKDGKPDPFLDAKSPRKLRFSKYTDRYEGYRRTAPARELTYDDDYKTYVVGAVAGAFPLAGKDATGEEAKKEREQRKEQFRRTVQGPLAELIKETTDGQKTDGTVSFLTGKLSSAKVWSTLAGGGFAIFWYGDDAARDLLAQKFTGKSFSTRRSLLSLSDEEWDHLSGEIAAREGLPKDVWEHVELAIGAIKVAIDIVKLMDGNEDKVQLALDWADALLAASEVMLKTTKLVRPHWFEVDGVVKAGGNALKVVGNVIKVVALLKELYTIFKTFWKLERGRLVKASDVYFALANIAVMVVALFVPVIGAIIGVVIMFVQSVFAYYSVSGMEAIPAWYCRTPWGENIYFSYAKHNGGELTWKDRKKLFIEGCNAMNKLLDEIYEKLKADQRTAFRQFYQSWAESNASVVGLTVSPFEDGKDYFLIKLYEGKREVTGRSAE